MTSPTESFVDLHMLSNFVHQIINPLNGVIGTLDNVIDGTTSPERRQQRLKVLRAQLEHTVELIRNLAYLSQLSVTSGIQELKQQRIPCVLPSIIIEAIQYYQEPGFNRGIKIQLADRETQYTVLAHQALLRQVFMNIFENGVKYGDENSSLTVTTRVEKQSPNLYVDITGRGIGFSDDEREKIFELGYRGMAAKKAVVPGTGIGLFVSRRILNDIHDAEITAAYNPQTRSARFTIRFPSHGMRSHLNASIK